MIDNILLLVILILLILIYKKMNPINLRDKENKELYPNRSDEIDNEIEEFYDNDLELLNYLSSDEREIFDVRSNLGYYSKVQIKESLKDPNSNIYKAIKHIKENGIKRNEKMELRLFSSNMERYREFLNQSKVFKRKDVIDSLNIINVEGGTVDDYKIFFLTTFTNLIYSNDLELKDLEIDSNYYGYGPSEAKSIWFDIDNIKEVKDGIDYKIFEADVVFTLKDKTKKILKYEFYDDTVDEFTKWFKKFEFIDEVGFAESFPYVESYNPKAKYRIVLNDLFQYLDFVGKHFYNKKFIKWDFLRYDFDSLLNDDYGSYVDISWQIDKKNFSYVDEIEKNDSIDVIDSMTDNELFVFAINLYYKEYNSLELDERIFKTIRYLDKLIEKEYPMAYLVKALLHLDGKIAVKDTNEAKRLLRKSYELGLYKPSILIWNENKLDEKGI